MREPPGVPDGVAVGETSALEEAAGGVHVHRRLQEVPRPEGEVVDGRVQAAGSGIRVGRRGTPVVGRPWDGHVRQGAVRHEGERRGEKARAGHPHAPEDGRVAPPHEIGAGGPRDQLGEQDVSTVAVGMRAARCESQQLLAREQSHQVGVGQQVARASPRQRQQAVDVLDPSGVMQELVDGDARPSEVELRDVASHVLVGGQHSVRHELAHGEGGELLADRRPVEARLGTGGDQALEVRVPRDGPVDDAVAAHHRQRHRRPRRPGAPTGEGRVEVAK